MQTFFSVKWKLIFLMAYTCCGRDGRDWIKKFLGTKSLAVRKAGDPKLVLLKREPFLPSKNAPKNGVCKNSTQRLTNIPSVT